jgi:hypothetical protein
MDLKSLPQEVLNHIYEYDDSYKKYFSYHVLNEIWRHHWLNCFRNMIIAELSKDSIISDKGKIFFFIHKIHIFDTPLTPSQITFFPIVCEQEDIQIKCCDYTSISFQVTVSTKKYNHVIFDGLILKTQCYQHEVNNIRTNGYYSIYSSMNVVLFEKNRKNEKKSRYLLQFYISIKYVLFVVSVISLFMEFC